MIGAIISGRLAAQINQLVQTPMTKIYTYMCLIFPRHACSWSVGISI